MKANAFIIMALLIFLAAIILPCCQILNHDDVIEVKVDTSQFVNDDNYSYIDLNLDSDSTQRIYYIKNEKIYNIGFLLWITNNNSIPKSFRIYAASKVGTGAIDTTDIIRDTRAVFISPKLQPDSQTHLDWPASLPYVRNFNYFRNLIRNRNIVFYVLTDSNSGNIAIDSMSLIISAEFQYTWL